MKTFRMENYIRIYQTISSFCSKRFQFETKRGIISSEKMRNSRNSFTLVLRKEFAVLDTMLEDKITFMSLLYDSDFMNIVIISCSS